MNRSPAFKSNQTPLGLLDSCQEQSSYRELCLRCLRAVHVCYCHLIAPIDPRIRFVILIHPEETKRRIATGRMSHLALSNSELIRGENFSENARVNAIIQNKKSFVLFPGPNSVDVTQLSADERSTLFAPAPDEHLVIFVIDGTWRRAKRMLRLSENLAALPRLCFSLERASGFGEVRRQPAPGCFSTIEAIHATIDLLGPTVGFDTTTREHDRILTAFHEMVRFQLEMAER